MTDIIFRKCEAGTEIAELPNGTFWRTTGMNNLSLCARLNEVGITDYDYDERDEIHPCPLERCGLGPGEQDDCPFPWPQG